MANGLQNRLQKSKLNNLKSHFEAVFNLGTDWFLPISIKRRSL